MARSLWSLILLVVIGCILSACQKGDSSDNGGDRMKIAFVYVGPVGDGGWTYAHEEGRKALMKEFPFLETLALESVPEGADADRVITQFAQKGCKVIFTTSFGYMDPTLRVAEKFPGTVFMHCSGYKRTKNVGTYFGRIYQPYYLAGLIAGSMMKGSAVGFVAPHPIPEVIRHINAFTLGVRKARPGALVRIVWTNSWFDPGKEKEAAVSLIDADCDIIATGCDSTAPLLAAQERGKLAFGYDSDGRRFAPKSFLTAPVWNWIVYYRKVVNDVRSGKWKSSDDWWGMETGLVKLAPYSDLVPAGVREKADKAALAIKSGKLKVFAGPILKQDGSTAVPEGESATDKELLGMKYFVQGVIGVIPTGAGH